MCGALSRVASSRCLKCGARLTEHSSIALLPAMQSLPPATVAAGVSDKFAEQVISNLRNGALSSDGPEDKLPVAGVAKPIVGDFFEEYSSEMKSAVLAGTATARSCVEAVDELGPCPEASENFSPLVSRLIRKTSALSRTDTEPDSISLPAPNRQAAKNSAAEDFVLVLPRKFVILAIASGFLFAFVWGAIQFISPLQNKENSFCGQYSFASIDNTGAASTLGQLNISRFIDGNVEGSARLKDQDYFVSGVCRLDKFNLALRPQVQGLRALRLEGDLRRSGDKTSFDGVYFLAPISSHWVSKVPVGFHFRAEKIEGTPPGLRKDSPTGLRNQPSTGSRNEQSIFQLIFWNQADPIATRFIKILITLVAVGLGLVWLSIKFFGIQGLLNIWEKEKYIPSQVMKQHKELLKELGAASSKTAGSLFLGERSDWGWHDPFSPRHLYLPAKRRTTNPHILVLGAGAKGKTRHLAGLIRDDILQAERAVVVVDSDGSLTELVLNWIAAHENGSKLISRVHIIEPCKREAGLGFNPFAFNDFQTLPSQAAAVVMGFKAVYTETQNSQNQWTQQTANILRNAVMLLMLNERTLADLPALLSDNDFRDLMLQKVERDHAQEWKTLLDAWSNYKRLARSESWINWIEPILNRVQPLLADPRLSRLLSDRENSVDLDAVLREKQILFVRVPEGQLQKGGNLLGSLIVTGLRQAALEQYEEDRRHAHPCSLYLDELNSFLDVELFDGIYSETRKLQLGIIGTLKTLQDLPEDFRNRAILSFGTIALFAIGKKDADILGPSMFRVDGRKIKKWNFKDWINPAHSQPTMEYVSDEEKLNIDRLLGQAERSYFCYLVGTIAGVFRMRSREFEDIPRENINLDLLEQAYDCSRNDGFETED